MDQDIEITSHMCYDDIQTITECFQKVVRKYPDKLAVVSYQKYPNYYTVDTSGSLKPRQEDRPHYVRWTYRVLNHMVQRFAKALSANEVRAGTPIFVFCHNQVEYLIATLAANLLALIHVAIDPRSLANINDIQHMVNTVIEHCKADRAVFLVNDTTAAERIDHLVLVLPTLKICVEANYADYFSFRSLLEKIDPIENEPEKQTADFNERSIFFTSGSTSFPKCCLIKPARWFHALRSRLSLGSASPEDNILVTAPASHAFGYICTMMPLLCGASITFASAKFDSYLLVDVILQAKCTHVAIVPTMVYSLIDELANSKAKIGSLKGMTMAGGAVSPELFKLCKERLGVTTIENFYGMTEGAFASTGPVSTENMGYFVNGRNITVGGPVQGGKLRICAPGKRTIVPKGVPGELHYSGLSMIPGYLGNRNEDFYDDDNEIWFVTGDRALVDHEDRLYILGRRKDMIVRGGNNISLSKIERVLTDVPELQFLEPQIVATTDPIAGEVPLTVIKRQTDYSLAKQVQDTIRSSLGVSHVPSQVIALESLGLVDYPRTPAGKIQKQKLAETVRVYQESLANGNTKILSKPSNLGLQIRTVWARVLGLQLDDIDVNRQLSEFTDSIIMLIARDKVRKETGQGVPLWQWNAAMTISEQINLYENHSARNRSKTSPQDQRTGAPEVEHLVHLGGDERGFTATKTAIEKTISQYGLSWGDVADICPCTDFTQLVCKSRAIDDWNIRTCIITKATDTEHLRASLEAVLFNNPVMLSFIVDTTDLSPDLGFHVMIRPTKEYLDRCILDYGVVKKVEDVRTITKDYPFSNHAKLPGPLFYAILLFVQETNSAAVITNCSHAILDGIYHGKFNEELDFALGGHILQPHSLFKPWADTYHMLRKSPIAEAAISFHREYLKDLKKHAHVLWPQPTLELTIPLERKNMELNFITFAAPSFARLRKRYPNLTTPVILKAALALLVTTRTNHSHAVFLSLEAGRSKFPFLPSSVASQGNYDAMDVAGPTFSGVINLVAFHPEETVLDYLVRVQETQASLSKHASVPWHEVFRQLDVDDPLSSIAQSLVFNWTPGMGPAILGENPLQNIEVLLTHIRTKIGMLACAGAGGLDGSQIFIYMEGALANTSPVLAKRAAEDMKMIALWLSDNASLSLPVGEFTRALGYD